MDFIKSDIAKKYILFDIYDVDEFVLKMAKNIIGSNYDCDLSNIKRRYIDFEIGENGYEEREMSKKEYELPSETKNYSTLNYKDFKTEFPLDLLDDYYDEWVHNNGFVESVISWIDKTEGDESKKLFIEDLVNKINKSKKSLSNIKCYWFNDTPLNPIQKKVITIHLRLNDVVLTEISKRYKHFLSKKSVDIDYEVGFKLNTGYGNHTKVLELLEEGGFIKKGTSKSDFIYAFNSSANKKIEKPIIWKGTKRALNYFISNLNKGVIDSDMNKYQKHWKSCNAVFRDKDGNIITNLSGNNNKPIKKVDKTSLDNIISQFKVRA